MNEKEIDVWLKHFANRPVGYQMYDENQVRKEFNLFNVFQYLKILQIENNQLKDECYKKRNDNKSLRGTLKATLETSNNRHNEIKRLLEKIEKLELNHKQLKDLDKTQISISKLLKEKEELKKWLEENKHCYIYQDGLGEDWYFEDLDVFVELSSILERGKE